MIHTVVTNLPKEKYKITILSYLHEEHFYDGYPEDAAYYSVEKDFGGDVQQAFAAAQRSDFIKLADRIAAAEELLDEVTK